MSDNIPPHEIQLEIIKKVLDVKALLRFRAVSKPWKSYIDSSQFIAGYGARDDAQPQSLLLRYKVSVDEDKYVSFIEDDDVSFPQQQQQDFSPNVPLLVKQLQISTLIGSSCGLWCVHGYDTSEAGMVAIWNPSIRKAVGIVVPCELVHLWGRITRFGFGVSPLTYDPTIVGIAWHLRECKSNVGVFTLSSRTWKYLPTSNVPRESVRVTSTTQVATDRFIFWVAGIVGNFGLSELNKLILSFDLITHKFTEVNLPVSLAKTAISISKLNESLVVSGYSDELTGRVYGVWMMGEQDGAMTSFTKLFTINTPDDSVVRNVLGYKKSGEPMIEIKTEKDEEHFTKIKVYDPCSEHIKDDFGITGIDGSFFICPYTETLLLTDHSDGCIIPYN